MASNSAGIGGSISSDSAMTDTQETQLETAYSESHSHDNKALLDTVEEAFTSDLKTYYDNSAQLDDSSKLKTAQIPDSLLAGLEWLGTIDATTDTLDDASSSNSGNFYKVSTGGTSSITGTSTDFSIGDWIISNGTTWEVVPTSFESATTSSQGVIKLANDLGGTADEPTVIGISGYSLDTAGKDSGTAIVMNSSVDGLEFVSVATSTTVTALDTRVGTLETDVEDIQTDITDIQTDVDNCATLDDDGKLETSQIPDSLVAGLEWVGTIDVTTDTLEDASSTNSGNFYKVTVGGTSSITGSEVTFTVGDWVISNGTDWEVIPYSSESATTTSLGVIMLAGDVGGTSSSLTVTGIQGIDVSETSPTDGQVLEYDSTSDSYIPASITATASVDTLESDDSTWSAVIDSGGFTVNNGTTDQVVGDSNGTRVKGYTGGSVATGYIGQTISTVGNSYYSTSSFYKTITLTAGVWVVYGNLFCDDSSTVSGYVKLGISQNTSLSAYYTTQLSSDSENDFGISCVPRYFTLSSSDVIYLVFDSESSRTATWYWNLWAMRIA